MHKGDKIGKYTIIKDFEVAGGMSKVSFAERSGKQYFIKEFLAPKFPIDGSPGSVATLNRKKERCNIFEAHHLKLNKAIETKCSIGGNLVFAVDFFRAGTAYYKVTEKIDISSLLTEDIAKLKFDRILIILKTVTHSLKILHDLGIVHGDLKPDNILIKQTTTGAYTTKLIDFDNSYFSSLPPEDSTEIVGTPEYYSPELGSFIKNSDSINKSDLTTKSDIFALGVIFTEYLTGKKPQFNLKYSSTWEAVSEGDVVEISGRYITDEIRVFILSMLQKKIEDRPSISQVFEKLSNKKTFSGEIVPSMLDRIITAAPPSVPELKGKGLEFKDGKKGEFRKEVANSKEETISKLKGKGLNIGSKK